MKVKKEGLIKILYRKYGYMYSKEKIAEIIEIDGAKAINKNVEYAGFGEWIINA